MKRLKPRVESAEDTVGALAVEPYEACKLLIKSGACVDDADDDEQGSVTHVSIGYTCTITGHV